MKELDRLIERFERWTGLDLDRGSSHSALERYLRLQLPADDPTALARYIDDLTTPHHPEALRLVDAITVCHTSFYRDPEQLAGITSVLRTEPTRLANVWIPACATGEDPYSIALIAESLGRPASILGTDINTRALAHATAGIYGPWSVRDLPSSMTLPRLADGRYEIPARLRRVVSFQRHNLMDVPPVVRGGWDIILCRNVLMYIARERVPEVITRLASSLRPGGYLFVGANDIFERAPAPLRFVRIGSRHALWLPPAPTPGAPTPTPPAGVLAVSPQPGMPVMMNEGPPSGSTRRQTSSPPPFGSAASSGSMPALGSASSSGSMPAQRPSSTTGPLSAQRPTTPTPTSPAPTFVSGPASQRTSARRPTTPPPTGSGSGPVPGAPTTRAPTFPSTTGSGPVPSPMVGSGPVPLPMAGSGPVSTPVPTPSPPPRPPLKPSAAHALLVSGNTSAALDLVLEVLEADPLCVEARLIAGIAYQLSGDAQQASAALRAALVLAPDLWPAEMYLGFALRQLGEEASARRALRRGAQLAASAERLPLSPSVATWFETWRVEAIELGGPSTGRGGDDRSG